MANERSYTAGRFALDLNGQIAGYIKSVKGGFTKAEVAVHNLGTDNVQTKHISTISHEPFTCEVGMGMTKSFYDWIQASFDKGCVTYSGEMVAADFDYKAQSARVFYDAHIAEVTIPALDGSSKEAAYMTLKIAPERIRFEKRGGEQLNGKIGTATKKWLCSNWRFELGDMPCQRVSKVDSFTWKQAVTKDQCGAFREPTMHPTHVEVPNLKVTFSMADIDKWRQWHQDFVIDGKCTDADELTGAINFLGPDLKEVLATIELDHVGIISLEEGAAEANKDEVHRATAELYVERMRFTNYGANDM